MLILKLRQEGAGRTLEQVGNSFDPRNINAKVQRHDRNYMLEKLPIILMFCRISFFHSPTDKHWIASTLCAIASIVIYVCSKYIPSTYSICIYLILGDTIKMFPSVAMQIHNSHTNVQVSVAPASSPTPISLIVGILMDL